MMAESSELLRTLAAAERRMAASAHQMRVVDCHTAGEPARVVLSGLPDGLAYQSAAELRVLLRDQYDHLRRRLITEPRGYPCQNCNFVVPSRNPACEKAFVIAEQGGVYPLMSGHNCIAVATALLETGIVAMREPVTRFQLEAPGGVVGIEAACSNGKAERISLRCPPAYARASDRNLSIEVPELGTVHADVAFGGMHYCIVDAASIGLRLEPSNGRQICRLGEMIKVACREQHPVQHPEFDYPGCDILCFRGPLQRDADGGVRARNTVVMSNGVLKWGCPETYTGMLDRSPCGTGTAAVMALLHARGELGLGQTFTHESIIGTVFTGSLEEEKAVGADPQTRVAGVVALISGTAWITQVATVFGCSSDPFRDGFTVGDIW